MLFREYRGLGNTPATVDLSQIAPPTEDHEKWVGSTKPGRALRSQHPGGQGATGKLALRQSHRDFLHRGNWRFRSQLVGGLGRRRRLREPEGSDDGRRSRTDQSRVRSYLAGGGFVFPPKTELQQSVDEGPAGYRQVMILCTFLPLFSMFWIVRFWPNKSDDRKIQRPW